MNVRIGWLLASLLLFACSDSGRWPSDKFDSATWHATADNQRYKLVNNLIDRRILLGLRAAEVQDLLGEPSSWGSDHTYSTYVVKVGGDGLNQVFVLDIRFDTPNGKVVSVGVRGD